jgi:hypothetical protein
LQEWNQARIAPLREPARSQEVNVRNSRPAAAGMTSLGAAWPGKVSSWLLDVTAPRPITIGKCDYCGWAVAKATPDS